VARGANQSPIETALAALCRVDLDLSFGWTAFERDALAARASTRYGQVHAPMARVEELLVFKELVAGLDALLLAAAPSSKKSRPKRLSSLKASKKKQTIVRRTRPLDGAFAHRVARPWPAPHGRER
jgi:hypothetical protein